MQRAGVLFFFFRITLEITLILHLRHSTCLNRVHLPWASVKVELCEQEKKHFGIHTAPPGRFHSVHCGLFSTSRDNMQIFSPHWSIDWLKSRSNFNRPRFSLVEYSPTLFSCLIHTVCFYLINIDYFGVT